MVMTRRLLHQVKNYQKNKQKCIQTRFPDLPILNSPYCASTCPSFIDSIPGFIAPNLLSEIRLMTQTQLMSLWGSDTLAGQITCRIEFAPF